MIRKALLRTGSKRFGSHSSSKQRLFCSPIIKKTEYHLSFQSQAFSAPAARSSSVKGFSKAKKVLEGQVLPRGYSTGRSTPGEGQRKKRSPLNPFGDSTAAFPETATTGSTSQTTGSTSQTRGSTPQTTMGTSFPFGKSSPSAPASASASSIQAGGESGGLPFRKNLPWTKPDFYDKQKLDDEMRRVFEICAGCRMCFNLCDSFPTLFDLIDQTPSESLDQVDSSQFKKVVDKCTLCDICFLAKCPYVPPHPFDIDFPHLMLRYKIVENQTDPLPFKLDKESTINAPMQKTTINEQKSINETNSNEQKSVNEINSNEQKSINETNSNEQKSINETNSNEQKSINEKNSNEEKISDSMQNTNQLTFKPASWNEKLLRNVDLMGKVGVATAPIANRVMQNGPSRMVMEKMLDVHRDAMLPTYAPSTLVDRIKKGQREGKFQTNPEGPSFGQKRKAVIFGTCLSNYHQVSIGESAMHILTHTGVETTMVYPQCCGMPALEGGNIQEVTAAARSICTTLEPYVQQGYDVISLIASCSLMMKLEWPNFLPDDPLVKRISQNTFDISEYVMRIAKAEGLIQGRQPLDQADHIVLHRACHSKAQNVGFKSQEMLKLIPNLKVTTIDRCSGHGGSFGVMKDTFPTAMKVGQPVFTRAVASVPTEKENVLLLSDCPLAAQHIRQGFLEENDRSTKKKSIKSTTALHPVELLYKSYFSESTP